MSKERMVMPMREFEMIYRDEVSKKAVMIYRYLRDRQGRHEFCYVSHKKIAADNKCGVSTVKRANGSKQSNLYCCT